MLRCTGLYTYEIDDAEIALADIKAQLEDNLKLLKNTVGILMCHPEFIASGVVKHICEGLPFDVVGSTTASQAVNNEVGELILTIFVITSDEVWFKTGVTEQLDEGIDEPVVKAFEKASSKASEPPGLVLIFTPLILKYSGDSYIYAIQKIMPSVPIFGAIAIDDTADHGLCETIHNGENYLAAMPFVLCYGNINPRFIVGTFPEENVMPYKGEITKSSGSLVQEINNIDACSYFESIGFVKDGVLLGKFNLMPFAIDQKKRVDYDGISVVRGLAVVNEDKTIRFRGDVDEGSVFTLLACEVDDVLSVTMEKIEQINALQKVNGALMFSCIVRRMMTMRDNPHKELEVVTEVLKTDIPFMMSYAGGEICPTLMKDGVPTNRFHNYSLVILVL